MAPTPMPSSTNFTEFQSFRRTSATCLWPSPLGHLSFRMKESMYLQQSISLFPVGRVWGGQSCEPLFILFFYVFFFSSSWWCFCQYKILSNILNFIFFIIFNIIFSACLCVHVCSYVHECGGQRSMSRVFLYDAPLILPEPRVHPLAILPGAQSSPISYTCWSPELTDWLYWLTSELQRSTPPSLPFLGLWLQICTA